MVGLFGRVDKNGKEWVHSHKKLEESIKTSLQMNAKVDINYEEVTEDIMKNMYNHEKDGKELLKHRLVNLIYSTEKKVNNIKQEGHFALMSEDNLQLSNPFGKYETNFKTQRLVLGMQINSLNQLDRAKGIKKNEEGGGVKDDQTLEMILGKLSKGNKLSIFSCQEKECLDAVFEERNARFRETKEEKKRLLEESSQAAEAAKKRFYDELDAQSHARGGINSEEATRSKENKSYFLIMYKEKTLERLLKNVNKNLMHQASSKFYKKELVNLRKRPFFRVSVKKLCFDNSLYISNDFPQVDFKHLVEKTRYPIVPNPYISQIRLFYYDEFEVIPYIILRLDQESSSASRKSNIFIFNDIFDNFIERIDFYWQVLNLCPPKTQIILFNYPGQAFSIYDQEQSYTNMSLAQLFDTFLFFLDQNKEISAENDIFKFVGFGYGANIVLTFLSLSEIYITGLKYLLLFNPFAYLDDIMIDYFDRLIEEMKSGPPDMLEISHYYYYTTMFGNVLSPEFLENKTKANPIAHMGRICLIRGLLSSINLKQKTSTIYVPMYICYSMKNFLVSMAHTDHMTNVSVNPYSGIGYFDKQTKRKVIYIEGGHEVLEESKEKVFDLLLRFIQKS